MDGARCVGAKALTLLLVPLASGLRQSTRQEPQDHAGKVKNPFPFGPEWVGKQERIVKRKSHGSSSADPFETAYHFDDWVSSLEEHFVNLGSPLYVRRVASSRNDCMLLSQRLHDDKSRLASSLTGGSAQCLQPRQSCAVVGSSKHLLNASFGNLIDKHDVIVRINAAPSGTKDSRKPNKRFSVHVGTRTDVRFVNMFGHVPAEQEKSARPLCVFLPEPKMPAACGPWCWRNPGFCNVTCRSFNHPKICTNAHCRLDNLTCTSTETPDEPDWGGRHVFLDNANTAIADQVVPHSTAGFKAVIYAMTICEKVSVLGFGPGCDGATGERYYQNGRGIHGWHHYGEELQLLRRASSRGAGVLAPPAARGRLRAKSVEVLLPSCVGPAAREELSSLFQSFHAGGAVNLLLRS